ncbi:hypothetical protein KIPB_010736, partial [Kipferlia bialata]|eukprot:g10736.t1
MGEQRDANPASSRPPRPRPARGLPRDALGRTAVPRRTSKTDVELDAERRMAAKKARLERQKAAAQVETRALALQAAMEKEAALEEQERQRREGLTVEGIINQEGRERKRQRTRVMVSRLSGVEPERAISNLPKTRRPAVSQRIQDRGRGPSRAA